MRTCTLLLLLVATVIAVAAPAAAAINDLGNKREPVNVNDDRIQGLGRWAVKQMGVLGFDKVVAAAVDDSGTNYELIIAASNRNGADGRYRAVVYVWGENRLISFEPVRPGQPPSHHGS